MISVCMALFNGERFVVEQLQSILVQLDPADEVIVVDDCSQDSSIAMVEAFRDPRIVLLRNAVNMGPSAAFERGIARARGTYIFLSDQDDVWAPNKISVTRTIFEATGALVVVSDARVVDSDRQTLADSLFSVRQSRPGFWRNLYKNGFVGCCMAIRSDIRPFLMPFPVNAGLHDEWIGLCASIGGRVDFCSKRLIDYRRHHGNVSKLDRGSLVSMMRKRASILFNIVRRLPAIIKWRLIKLQASDN